MVIGHIHNLNYSTHMVFTLWMLLQLIFFPLKILDHGLFGKMKIIASRSNLETARKEQLQKVAPSWYGSTTLIYPLWVCILASINHSLQTPSMITKKYILYVTMLKHKNIFGYQLRIMLAPFVVFLIRIMMRLCSV